MPPLLLALDTGSPRVTVAVGRGGEVLATAGTAQAGSAERLLGLIDRVLSDAGHTLADLDGAVALRGPGSFTGLRVGLATLLGLHQAVALRACALPTLEALAAEPQAADAGTVVAAVDALRGEWFVQPFEPGPPPRALASPQRRHRDRLADLAPCAVVGCGVEALAAAVGHPPEMRWIDVDSLAPLALRLAHLRPPDWDPGTLVSPLYLRAPAATPAPRRSGGTA